MGARKAGEEMNVGFSLCIYVYQYLYIAYSSNTCLYPNCDVVMDHIHSILQWADDESGEHVLWYYES